MGNWYRGNIEDGMHSASESVLLASSRLAAFPRLSSQRSVATILGKVAQCIKEVADHARKNEWSQLVGSCRELGIYLKHLSKVREIQDLVDASEIDLFESLAETLEARHGMILASRLSTGEQPKENALEIVEKAAGTFRAAAALVEVLPMDKKIVILFLGANPSEATHLALGREVREIRDRIRSSELRDVFELKQEWAVGPMNLQECLLSSAPTVVHFSGHGSSSGELMFEGKHRAITVPVDTLSHLFKILRGDIRCVILNACYSNVQAEAIANHVDCVIGMRAAIGDESAIAFSSSFYQALGYGRDVKTAFELGCNQIDLGRLGPSDIPKLITRHGIVANNVHLGAGRY